MCGRVSCLPLSRLLVLLVLLSGQGTFAQQCYHYSWLGPDSVGKFKPSEQLWHSAPTDNKEYQLGLGNRTCEKYPKPKPIPCINPFVLTSDSSVPNATEFHQTYGKNVTCTPGKGEVCAVVVFYFNDAVYNITAYCTRVSVDGEPFTGSPSACISTQKGAYVNQVCVCDPEKDLCNDGTSSAHGTLVNRQSAHLLLGPLAAILLHKITG